MIKLKIRGEKLKLVGVGIIIVIGVSIFVWLREKEGFLTSKGKVLARVGNTVLTESDFYNLIPSQYAEILTPFQKKELLRKWIDTELVYQAAVKAGLHKEREMKLKLHQIQEEVIANEFIDRYIAKVGGVEESDVKSYFDAHRSHYNTERKIAQIVVLDSAQASALVARLREGEDFSALARQYSLDPSAQRGGEIGYLRRGDIPQLVELEEPLFSLRAVGDISEPIQTSYGYYILKLLDIKELAQEVKYEDVKEKVQGFLDLAKRKKAFIDFMAEIRTGKKIEANYELFE